MQGDVTEDVNAEQRAKAEEKLAPKTKADLIDAMMRYGDKYDGTREQEASWYREALKACFAAIDPALRATIAGIGVTLAS